MKKTNFIFIFADDLGYGDLGCYGNEAIKTPNLDRMANEGTCFMDFHVASPVCSPSRCTVLTGHYPARHMVHGHFCQYPDNESREMPNWLDPNVVTLPKLLKNSGYRTAHYGKWHLGGGGGMHGHPDAPKPIEYGYDDTRVWNGNGPNWNGLKKWPFELHNDADEIFLPHSDMLACTEAIEFIKTSQKEQKPFFINLWLRTPHTPHRATEEQREPYKDIPEPFQTYYSIVTEADKQIGRVLDSLAEFGLEEDTLVIFSSDNGPESVHPSNLEGTRYCQGSTGGLRGRKRSLYEGGVRVPFIVRQKGKVPPRKYDYEKLLSSADILPTFCDIAGVPLPEDYRPDGVVMTDALYGRDWKREIPLMWEWLFADQNDRSKECPSHALRDGDFVYLKNLSENREELYDLSRDERQLENIAKKHRDICLKMSAQIDEWTTTLSRNTLREQLKV